jgi:WD40 repeat protein
MVAYSASGARKLIRWDMETGTPCLCLQQKQGSRTKCMHLSADGTIAVVLLYDSTMAVYDTRSGALVCELMRKGERDAMRVHSGGVNGVLLTADGSRAISWSKDATARVWDAVTGACLLVLQV